KSEGDRIEKDEPILEISTDKVDAEVPSPGAGILLKINTREGETVEVGTVVAVIGEEGEKPTSTGDAPKAQAASAPVSAPPVVEPTTEAPRPIAATSSDHPPTGTGTPVVMPQMGESITEGTVSKWLKKVGDDIAKDEPLLEISTDKVDAEVPSPAAGKLLQILVNEGETVEVGSVLALVGADGAVSALVPSPRVPAEPIDKPKLEEPKLAGSELKPEAARAATASPANGGNGARTVEDLRRTKSSPLVRNIAREHGI